MCSNVSSSFYFFFLGVKYIFILYLGQVLQVLAWRHWSLWWLQSDLCRGGAPGRVRRQDLHSRKGEHILKGLSKLLFPGSKEYACTCSCGIWSPSVWLTGPQCEQPYLTVGVMCCIRAFQNMHATLWFRFARNIDCYPPLSHIHLFSVAEFLSWAQVLGFESCLSFISIHSALNAAEPISLNQRTNSVNARYVIQLWSSDTSFYLCMLQVIVLISKTSEN